MRWFVEHSYVTFIIALAGLAIGFLSLIKPEYQQVTDGAICGFTEKTSQHRDHQFKLCTHPNHGITGYQHSEVVSGSSGWRGGGYNQVAWCNDVKRAKERSVGQSIVWSQETRSEGRKKDWLGKAEYNYHCTIPAKWGPIYAAKRSPACGEEPYLNRTEQVAKTCIDESKRVGWKWSWQ